MSATVKSLTIVLTIVLFGLSSTWFYLRNSGLAKPITPLETTYFDKAKGTGPLVIAYQGASNELAGNTLPAFEKAAALGADIILWADVQMTEDRVPIVQHDRETENYKEGVHLKVETLLTRFPEQRFVLNIVDYRPGFDAVLTKVVDEANAGSRIIIQSQQDGILRDLRSLRPLWLFGTSQAQITQLNMLLSLKLEPAAPLKGDVLIVFNGQGDTHLVSSAMVTEAHRRKMRVLAGLVTSPEAATHFREIGVDGLITKDPSALKAK